MTVFLVIKQSMRDCAPNLQIKTFDAYDKAAEYSRVLIDEAIKEWRHDVGTLLRYDSNRDYQDDDVLVEKYDMETPATSLSIAGSTRTPTRFTYPNRR